MDILKMSNFKKFDKSFFKKKTHKNKNFYFISINGNKIKKCDFGHFSLSSFYNILF